jgi:maleate cis-trans isomerase
VVVRLGLVKPGATAGRENLSFWKDHAPGGVEIESAELGYSRGDRKTFKDGWDRAERLVRELADRGCDLVVVSGTPPFLLEGLASERRWRKAVSKSVALPVITAMEAHALALQAIGASRVAVATYYGAELNRAVARYLGHFDIEVELLGGFSLTGESEGLFSTPMGAQAEITSEQVYDYCHRGVRDRARDAEALYINGAGWDVAPVITKLEHELNADVVWGPVGEMWLSYAILGITNTQPDCGRLLRSEEAVLPVATLEQEGWDGTMEERYPR